MNIVLLPLRLVDLLKSLETNKIDLLESTYPKITRQDLKASLVELIFKVLANQWSRTKTLRIFIRI